MHTHTRTRTYALEQPPSGCCSASCILGAEEPSFFLKAPVIERKTAQREEKARFNIVGPRHYVSTATVIIRSLFGSRGADPHRRRNSRAYRFGIRRFFLYRAESTRGGTAGAFIAAQSAALRPIRHFRSSATTTTLLRPLLPAPVISRSFSSGTIPVLYSERDFPRTG